MSYTHFDHKHNFAAWAGARAVQRGWKGAETDVLKRTLETCGIVAFLQQPESLAISAPQFDALHQQWCRQIVTDLRQAGLEAVTFGRAAKLLAVYLKIMVVIGQPDSSLASVAHPPIDAIMLENMAAAQDIHNPHKSEWRAVRWTKLTQDEYHTLFKQLRDCLDPGEPLWHLERYWKTN